MARVDTLTNFLTDVADAIRTKTGSQETIQASDFDTEIENIPSGGGLDWSAIGYSGTPQSVIDGYNYAKQIYDNNDPDTAFSNQQYKSDKNLIYFPPITKNVGGANSLFYNNTSLQEIADFTINNTSVLTNINYMCYSCANLRYVKNLTFISSKDTQAESVFNQCQRLEKIGEITLTTKGILNFFNNCNSLTTISKINDENLNDLRNAFSNCTSLTNFGGIENLGKAYDISSAENYFYYTLDLSACTLLTHDSLMNVINKLYDIKTKGCQNQSLVLGSTNLAKLTAEEIAIATDKGWNVS